MAGSDANGTTSNQSGAAGADGKVADASASDATDESALGAPPEKKPDAPPADKDGQAAGKKPDDKAPEKKPDAPAPLELKLPEGLDAKAPDIAPVVENLMGLAKDAGLNPEQAQKVADAYFKSTEADRKAIADAQAERKGHLTAARSDKELGGAKGEKFTESVNFARAAIERLGGEKLRHALVSSGLDNHPEIIRAFMRAGRALAEDQLDGSALNGTAPKPKSDLEAVESLYTKTSTAS